MTLLCLDVLLLVPVPKLCSDQHVVNSLLGQQLLMCPLFHHHSSLKDHDTVCVLDGGQTVGHNDTCPALTGLVQRILHHLQMKKGGVCYVFSF